MPANAPMLAKGRHGRISSELRGACQNRKRTLIILRHTAQIEYVITPAETPAWTMRRRDKGYIQRTIPSGSEMQRSVRAHARARMLETRVHEGPDRPDQNFADRTGEIAILEFLRVRELQTNRAMI
jgi:hypothetical protein